MPAIALDPRGEIESVAQFVEQLMDLRREHQAPKNPKIWYRGIGVATHPLIPTIGRDYRYVGKEHSFTFKEEWQLLHRFRRRGYLEWGRLPPAGEALFIARHHGLPTRLLDWTANALYGLYFACSRPPTAVQQPGERNTQHSEETERDGALWGLIARRDRDYIDGLKVAAIADERRLLAYLDGRPGRYPKNNTWEEHPRRLKLLEPPFNSRRLLAQDGIFTVHNCPHHDLKSFVDKDLAESDLDVETFLRWDVPGKYKQRLVEELSGLGLTHRTVYPDLDGIAKSLAETDLLWSENPPKSGAS